MRRRRGCRGTSLLEFTLVGIPLVFLLTSTMEMSRAMWNYHTLASSVQATARYIAVHGQGCTQNSNSCTATLDAIAHKIAGAAIGIDQSAINLTLTTNSGVQTACNPVTHCFGDTTQWPPNSDNAPGADIQVQALISFQSPLSLFWPGQRSMSTAAAYFPAYSRQQMQF